VFLESFAELEFCIQANHSSIASTTTSYTAPRRNLSTTPAAPDFSLGWNMVNVRLVDTATVSLFVWRTGGVAGAATRRWKSKILNDSRIAHSNSTVLLLHGCGHKIY